MEICLCVDVRTHNTFDLYFSSVEKHTWRYTAHTNLQDLHIYAILHTCSVGFGYIYKMYRSFLFLYLFHFNISHLFCVLARYHRFAIDFTWPKIASHWYGCVCVRLLLRFFFFFRLLVWNGIRICHGLNLHLKNTKKNRIILSLTHFQPQDRLWINGNGTNKKKCVWYNEPSINSKWVYQCLRTSISHFKTNPN